MAIETQFSQGALNPFAAPATKTYGQNLQNPNDIVKGTLESMLDPNSSYIQNARQRGMEVAATRGGVNSSIAAGASERAAIDAAAPLATQSLEIQGARENLNAQNWMNQQDFSRSLTAQQFGNTSSMLNFLTQAGIDDPELFTPEVISGYSNFFENNMRDILGKYFG